MEFEYRCCGIQIGHWYSIHQMRKNCNSKESGHREINFHSCAPMGALLFSRNLHNAKLISAIRPDGYLAAEIKCIISKDRKSVV